MQRFLTLDQSYVVYGVVGNRGLKGPAIFFVCLLYQLLNDAQKDTKKF